MSGRMMENKPGVEECGGKCVDDLLGRAKDNFRLSVEDFSGKASISVYYAAISIMAGALSQYVAGFSIFSATLYFMAAWFFWKAFSARANLAVIRMEILDLRVCGDDFHFSTFENPHVWITLPLSETKAHRMSVFDVWGGGFWVDGYVLVHKGEKWIIPCTHPQYGEILRDKGGKKWEKVVEPEKM